MKREGRRGEGRRKARKYGMKVTNEIRKNQEKAVRKQRTKR